MRNVTNFGLKSAFGAAVAGSSTFAFFETIHHTKEYFAAQGSMSFPEFTVALVAMLAIPATVGVATAFIGEMITRPMVDENSNNSGVGLGITLGLALGFAAFAYNNDLSPSLNNLGDCALAGKILICS